MPDNRRLFVKTLSRIAVSFIFAAYILVLGAPFQVVGEARIPDEGDEISVPAPPPPPTPVVSAPPRMGSGSLRNLNDPSDYSSNSSSPVSSTALSTSGGVSGSSYSAPPAPSPAPAKKGWFSSFVDKAKSAASVVVSRVEETVKTVTTAVVDAGERAGRWVVNHADDIAAVSATVATAAVVVGTVAAFIPGAQPVAAAALGVAKVAAVTATAASAIGAAKSVVNAANGHGSWGEAAVRTGITALAIAAPFVAKPIANAVSSVVKAVAPAFAESVASLSSKIASVFTNVVAKFAPEGSLAAQWAGKTAAKTAVKAVAAQEGKTVSSVVTKSKPVVVAPKPPSTVVKPTSPTKGPVQAGEAGAFSELRKQSVRGDGIDLHHMPQKALGFTGEAKGGALALPEGEHALTRTYLGKGAVAAKQDAGLNFRDVLAKDIRDVRNIAGSKYNQGLRNLANYYNKTFPELMKKR